MRRQKARFALKFLQPGQSPEILIEEDYILQGDTEEEIDKECDKVILQMAEKYLRIDCVGAEDLPDRRKRADGDSRDRKE